MEEDKRYELEEFIQELEGYKGRHTELVTVYVPQGYSLINIAKQLEQEKSTATNIKSKVTRKNVLDALEKLTRHIKLIKKNPPNGLALFAGNVNETEGQAQVEVWSIEPPMPLKARLYRCDQEFVLDPLREMLEVSEVYGLVVIEINEATIGLLEGKNIKVLQHMTSGVPGKTEKGGQCLSPDTIVEIREGPKRITDVEKGDELKAFDIGSKKIIFTKCLNKWDQIKEKYLQLIVKDCWSIVSSEDHTFFKEDAEKIIEVKAKDLSSNNYLITHYDSKLSELQIKKIIKVNKELKMVDIETESGNFFANGILVHNSAARYGRIREGMKKEFYRRVAEAVKDNFFDMKKLKGIIVGGPGPTKEDFLKEGQIVTALKNKIIGVKDIGYADQHGLEILVETSKDLLAEQEITREKKILEDFFTKLAKHPEKIAYGAENVNKALDVGAVDTLIISKKLDKKKVKQLGEKAENTAAEIKIVSEETEEGKQFKNLGGVGAVLRFAV